MAHQSQGQRSCCIVGAGITGLVCARALLEAGVSVIVVEAASDIFPGRSTWRVDPELLEKHPDLLPLLSLPEYLPPSGASPEELHRYLLGYVEHFGLRQHIIFSCRLEHAVVGDDGVWTIVCSDLLDPARLHRLSADFLVISAGACLAPAIPALPGSADFMGLRCHARDLREPHLAASLVAGQRVVVAGDDRGAVECARRAAEAGAASVTLLYRQPHWPLPPTLCGRALPHLAHSRCLPALLLPPYYTAGRGARALGSALRPLRRLFWWRLERRLAAQHGLTPDTTPPVDILRDMFYSSQASGGVDNWVGLLRDSSVRLVRGEVCRLGPDALVLKDGCSLPANVLVHCTPHTRSYTVFDPELQTSLGVRKDGLHLYRSMVPPAVPSLAFLGCDAVSPFAWLTASLQAHWVAALVAGRLRLPAMRAMKADVYRQRRWRRVAFPPQHNRGSLIQWYAQAYHDQLLRDLGMDPRVKASLAPGCGLLGSLGRRLCAAHTPQDYRHTFSALSKARAGKPPPPPLRPAAVSDSGDEASESEAVLSDAIVNGGVTRPRAPLSARVPSASAAAAANAGGVSVGGDGSSVAAVGSGTMPPELTRSGSSRSPVRRELESRTSTDPLRALGSGRRVSSGAVARAVLAQVSVTSSTSRLHLALLTSSRHSNALAAVAAAAAAGTDDAAAAEAAEAAEAADLLLSMPSYRSVGGGAGRAAAGPPSPAAAAAAAAAAGRPASGAGNSRLGGTLSSTGGGSGTGDGGRLLASGLGLGSGTGLGAAALMSGASAGARLGGGGVSHSEIEPLEELPSAPTFFPAPGLFGEARRRSSGLIPAWPHSSGGAAAAAASVSVTLPARHSAVSAAGVGGGGGGSTAAATGSEGGGGGGSGRAPNVPSSQVSSVVLVAGAPTESWHSSGIGMGAGSAAGAGGGPAPASAAGPSALQAHVHSLLGRRSGGGGGGKSGVASDPSAPSEPPQGLVQQQHFQAAQRQQQHQTQHQQYQHAPQQRQTSNPPVAGPLDDPVSPFAVPANLPSRESNPSRSSASQVPTNLPSAPALSSVSVAGESGLAHQSGANSLHGHSVAAGAPGVSGAAVPLRAPPAAAGGRAATSGQLGSSPFDALGMALAAGGSAAAVAAEAARVRPSTATELLPSAGSSAAAAAAAVASSPPGRGRNISALLPPAMLAGYEVIPATELMGRKPSTKAAAPPPPLMAAARSHLDLAGLAADAAAATAAAAAGLRRSFEELRHTASGTPLTTAAAAAVGLLSAHSGIGSVGSPNLLVTSHTRGSPSIMQLGSRGGGGAAATVRASGNGMRLLSHRPSQLGARGAGAPPPAAAAAAAAAAPNHLPSDIANDLLDYTRGRGSYAHPATSPGNSLLLLLQERNSPFTTSSRATTAPSAATAATGGQGISPTLIAASPSPTGGAVAIGAAAATAAFRANTRSSSGALAAANARRTSTMVFSNVLGNEEFAELMMVAGTNDGRPEGVLDVQDVSRSALALLGEESEPELLLPRSRTATGATSAAPGLTPQHPTGGGGDGGLRQGASAAMPLRSSSATTPADAAAAAAAAASAAAGPAVERPMLAAARSRRGFATSEGYVTAAPLRASISGKGSLGSPLGGGSEPAKLALGARGLASSSSGMLGAGTAARDQLPFPQSHHRHTRGRGGGLATRLLTHHASFHAARPSQEQRTHHRDLLLQQRSLELHQHPHQPYPQAGGFMPMHAPSPRAWFGAVKELSDVAEAEAPGGEVERPTPTLGGGARAASGPAAHARQPPAVGNGRGHGNGDGRGGESGGGDGAGDGDGDGRQRREVRSSSLLGMDMSPLVASLGAAMAALRSMGSKELTSRAGSGVAAAAATAASHIGGGSAAGAGVYSPSPSPSPEKAAVSGVVASDVATGFGGGSEVGAAPLAVPKLPPKAGSVGASGRARHSSSSSSSSSSDSGSSSGEAGVGPAAHATSALVPPSRVLNRASVAAAAAASEAEHGSVAADAANASLHATPSRKSMQSTGGGKQRLLKGWQNLKSALGLAPASPKRKAASGGTLAASASSSSVTITVTHVDGGGVPSRTASQAATALPRRARSSTAADGMGVSEPSPPQPSASTTMTKAAQKAPARSASRYFVLPNGGSAADDGSLPPAADDCLQVEVRRAGGASITVAAAAAAAAAMLAASSGAREPNGDRTNGPPPPVSSIPFMLRRRSALGAVGAAVTGPVDAAAASTAAAASLSGYGRVLSGGGSSTNRSLGDASPFRAVPYGGQDGLGASESGRMDASTPGSPRQAAANRAAAAAAAAAASGSSGPLLAASGGGSFRRYESGLSSASGGRAHGQRNLVRRGSNLALAVDIGAILPSASANASSSSAGGYITDATGGGSVSPYASRLGGDAARLLDAHSTARSASGLVPGPSLGRGGAAAIAAAAAAAASRGGSALRAVSSAAAAAEQLLWQSQHQAVPPRSRSGREVGATAVETDSGMRVSTPLPLPLPANHPRRDSRSFSSQGSHRDVQGSGGNDGGGSGGADLARACSGSAQRLAVVFERLPDGPPPPPVDSAPAPRARTLPRRRPSLLRAILTPSPGGFGAAAAASTATGFTAVTAPGQQQQQQPQQQPLRRLPKRVASEIPRRPHASLLFNDPSGLLRLPDNDSLDLAAGATAALHSPNTAAAPRRGRARRNSVIDILLTEMAEDGSLGGAAGTLKGQLAAAGSAAGGLPSATHRSGQGAHVVVDPHAPEGVLAWERPRGWDTGESEFEAYAAAIGVGGGELTAPERRGGGGGSSGGAALDGPWMLAAAGLPSVILGHAPLPSRDGMAPAPGPHRAGAAASTPVSPLVGGGRKGMPM